MPFATQLFLTICPRLLFLYNNITQWGEEMVCEEGDFLATTFPPDGKNDIYRIEKSAFVDTYTRIEDN